MKQKIMRNQNEREPRLTRATTSGHVNGIKDDETSVEGVLGVEADGLSTGRDGGGLVDGHDGVSVVLDVNEALVPSSRGVNVLIV